VQDFWSVFIANQIHLGPKFPCKMVFNFNITFEVFQKVSASALSNIFEVTKKKRKIVFASKSGSSIVYRPTIPLRKEVHSRFYKNKLARII
jgi:hypothetical protein